MCENAFYYFILFDLDKLFKKKKKIIASVLNIYFVIYFLICLKFECLFDYGGNEK